MVLMFRFQRVRPVTRTCEARSPRLGRRRGSVSRVTAVTAVVVAVLAASVTGCRNSATEPRLQIVAALYPLEYVARKVVGTGADVTSLANGAVEPHDQELTAKQRASLANATQVLYIKGMSPSVDEAVSGASNATEVLSLLGDQARTRDPHMWLNPLLLAQVGQALASNLADIDPSNATSYATNAAALTASLTQLDSAIRTATARCDERLMVTTHGAFAYFASRYKFRQVNVLGTNPEAQPSPAVIARLVSVIRENKVSSVYAEVGGESSIAATLASETGTKVRLLYPIEVAVPGQDYISMMNHNLGQVVAGQVCVRRVGGGASLVTPDTSSSG